MMRIHFMKSRISSLVFGEVLRNDNILLPFEVLGQDLCWRVELTCTRHWSKKMTVFPCHGGKQWQATNVRLPAVNVAERVLTINSQTGGNVAATADERAPSCPQTHDRRS
jgi:hypothetical protein